MIFLACDPGSSGALGAFDKEQKKIIDFVYDFDERKYKDFLLKYKGTKMLLEYIATVMGGSFASFQLGKNIGSIKGLSYGLVEVIEKDNTPQSWKKPWNEEIKELKKQKNDKGKLLTNKEIDIILCKRHYPEFNISVPELDENGQPKIIKKGLDKGKINYKEHDGLADMCLIGNSAIIRGLV